MGKRKNTNCLAGIQCPECNALEPFNISVTTCATFYDDGTDDVGDMEFDDDSFCRCMSCHKVGVVADFKKPSKKKAER